MVWLQICGKLFPCSTFLNSLMIPMHRTLVGSMMTYFQKSLRLHASTSQSGPNIPFCLLFFVGFLWSFVCSTVCHHQVLITVEATSSNIERMRPSQLCLCLNFWCFQVAFSVDQYDSIIVWGSSQMFVSNLVVWRFSCGCHVTYVLRLVYLWALNPIVGDTSKDSYMLKLLISYWCLNATIICLVEVSNHFFRFKHVSVVQVSASRRPSVVQLFSSQIW